MNVVKYICPLIMACFPYIIFSQIHVDDNSDVGIGTDQTQNAKLRIETDTIDNSTGAYILVESPVPSTGVKQGLGINLSDDGTGKRIGIGNVVYQNSSSSKYTRGIVNNIFTAGTGAGSLAHNSVGLKSKVQGTAANWYLGLYSEVFQNTDDAYGVWSKVTSGSTSSPRYGVLSEIYGTPTGGSSYGVWSKIYDTDTTKTQYAIYGATGGAGSQQYAGYFAGNLHHTGNLTSASDRQLKENISSLENILSLIRLLEPKRYTYLHDNHLNLPDGEQFGLIAQEVEAIFPQLVQNITHPGRPIVLPAENEEEITGLEIEESETYKGVNYIMMIPILLQAIKEQQAIIDNLNLRLITIGG